MTAKSLLEWVSSGVSSVMKIKEILKILFVVFVIRMHLMTLGAARAISAF